MKKLDDFNKMVDSLVPNQELDKDDLNIITSLLSSDDSKLNKEIKSDDPEIKQYYGFQILLKRLEILTSLKITLGALIAIGLHIENAGQAVMYAYYLHRKCDDNTTITINKVSNDLFSMGMISNEQHKELWEAQKLKTKEEQEEAEPLMRYAMKDNLLDYELTWEK